MLINIGCWVCVAALTLGVPVGGDRAQTPKAQTGPPANPSPPPELQTLYQQGERALAAGRYAEAEKAYLRMRELQPAVAEVHARLGLIYFQEGRFADAVAPLQRALQLKPALPNIDSLLAMALSERGRHKEALPGLEKAFHQTTDPAIRRMAGLHL